MVTQRRLYPKSDEERFLDALKYGKQEPILVGPNIRLEIDSNLNLSAYTYEPKEKEDE